MKLHSCILSFFLLSSFFLVEQLSAQGLPWINPRAPGTSSKRLTQITGYTGQTLFGIGTIPGTTAIPHLFATEDLGRTWNPASSTPNVTGFAIGSTGIFYTSANGTADNGIDTTTTNPAKKATWVSLPPFNLPPFISALFVRTAIDGLGGDELWAATDTGLWFRNFRDTIWTLKKSIFNPDTLAIPDTIEQITGAGKNIYFRTKNKVFASHDTGSNWQDITQTTTGTVTSILAPSEMEFLYSVTALGSGYVFHSPDGGNTFTDPNDFHTTTLSGRTIEALAVNSVGDLFLGGGLRGFPPEVITNAFVMKFPHTDNHWILFSTGLDSTMPHPPEVISLGLSQDQHLFAGTDSEGVWRTTGTSAVKNLPSESGIALSNAYPNPALSSTEFSLSTDHEIKADISIFDALGRKLLDIFEGIVSPGDHFFTIDTKNFAAGTYFYRIQTAEATQSRMFVVTK